MASTGHSSSSGRSQRGNGATRPGHSFYDDALSLAGTLLRGRREMGADKIQSLAEAARDFAAKLPNMPNVKSYAADAAGRLEDLSGYIAETDFEQIIADTTAFARRNPMVTLGAAIVAGWWVTRMFYSPTQVQPVRSAPGRRRPAKQAASKRGKTAQRAKAA